MRGARTKRDRVLLQVLYAGGLRVSEVAGLTWADVLARDHGQVQLSVTGKGGVVRQVLLPEAVSRALLSLRGDSGANGAVFTSRKSGAQLGEHAILGLVKRAAARAGLEAPVSPHWLRHAHASHAIDRGATLPEVQATLGHGDIATTSGYLACPAGVVERAKARSRDLASMKVTRRRSECVRPLPLDRR